MCLIFLAFNIFIMCVAEPGMCSRCGEISKITAFNSFFKQKANCSKTFTVLVEHHLISTTQLALVDLRFHQAYCVDHMNTFFNNPVIARH